MIERKGWIGFDFDGTLAHYESGMWPVLGKPIPSMVERLKNALSDGYEVRIITARSNYQDQIEAIKDWLEENGIPRLEVTDKKDHEMIEFYDDRAIQVIKNKGLIATVDCYDNGFKDGYRLGFNRGFNEGVASGTEFPHTS